MHKLLKTLQTRNLINISQRFFRAPRIENPTVLDNVSERKRKKNNLYSPKQALVFENGKLPLIDSKKSVFIKDVVQQIYFFTGVSLSSAAVAIGTLASGSYIAALVSGCVSLLFLKYRSNHSQNLSRVVTEFNLLESGKEVEIVTIKKKFEVNIKLLAKPNKIQAHALNVNNPELVKVMTPFVVDKGVHKGFYYIAPDVSFENKEELISAIMNHSYIEVFNRIGSKKVMN